VKNSDMMEDICKHLLVYKNKNVYISNYRKEFGSEDAALTYVFAQMLRDEKEHVLEGQPSL
jgi:hypothetical protein